METGAETAPYLKPMKAGEILLQAFRLYRDHLALLVTVSLLPLLPLVPLAMLLPIASEEGVIPTRMLVLAMVNGVIYGLVLAAIATAICRIAVGESPSILDVFYITLRRKPTSVVLAFLAINFAVSLVFFPSLVVGQLVFAILNMIPALIAGGLLMPAIPAIVVERRSTIGGLARSIALARREWPKAAAVFAYFVLVVIVVPFVLLTFQASLGIGPFLHLLGAIIGAATLPLGFSAVVLLYFSLRSTDQTERELLLADLMGEPPPTPPPEAEA